MFFGSPINILIAVSILLAIVLFLVSRVLAETSGIPKGRIVASDHGEWRKTTKPLYDASLGLTGKPDYLIELDGRIIPAEVKSSCAPKTPYHSHLMQLAAYCVLVDRSFGERPPYGILRYRDHTFNIPFTQEIEDELLELIGTVRHYKNKNDVPRSHNHPARCAHCGYRNSCDQRL